MIMIVDKVGIIHLWLIHFNQISLLLTFRQLLRPVADSTHDSRHWGAGERGTENLGEAAQRCVSLIERLKILMMHIPWHEIDSSFGVICTTINKVALSWTALTTTTWIPLAMTRDA